MLEMNQIQAMKLFEQIEFFRLFTVEEKQLLLNFKHYLVGFKQGEMIVRQGEKDCALFLLLRGRVFITKKERPNIRINELKPGAIFGEASFLSQRARMSNVVADNDVNVLKLDWDLMKSIPPEMQNKIKDQIIEVLINRLDSMNKILYDIIR